MALSAQFNVAFPTSDSDKSGVILAIYQKVRHASLTTHVLLTTCQGSPVQQRIMINLPPHAKAKACL